MIPVARSYANPTEAQAEFEEILQEVGQGKAIVIVQRPEQADVALIAAEELYILWEEIHLLRSPANIQRLFSAIDWSEKQLSQEPSSQSLAELRAEMEQELEQEKSAEA